MNIQIGKGQYLGRLNRENQVELIGKSGMTAIVDEKTANFFLAKGRLIL